jgi:hypothetical protein
MLPIEKEFEVTKRVIKILKSKKDRQHSGQKIKDKKITQRSTKHTHKTKDRVTRTPLETDIAKILLKVALKHQTFNQSHHRFTRSKMKNKNIPHWRIIIPPMRFF